MSFEEEFPSLKGAVRTKLSSNGQPTNFITLSKASLYANCLDKQRVREAIEKARDEVEDAADRDEAADAIRILEFVEKEFGL